MPTGEKKGITVKIDADLHNQIREYLDTHEMTMAEFITLAADNELHPKYNLKEGNKMANTRTIAFQVPEDLFQRIKDYLQRSNMTQRQFIIGLIEDELSREMLEREEANEDNTHGEYQGDAAEEGNGTGGEPEDGAEDESEDEFEDEEQGFSMSM